MKRTPGVNLMADEAEFAGRIFDAFGEERFTRARYFASIERSNYQRMPAIGQPGLPGYWATIPQATEEPPDSVEL
jgi:hypothetical protein